MIHRLETVMKKITAVFLIMALGVISILTQQTTIQASSGYSFILLSQYQKTMEIGQSFYLIGIAGNGKRITWKSTKSAVASVNTYGQVTAKKAGSCFITGKVSGAEASCRITVRKTNITLSSTKVTLENKATAILRGTTSNGTDITWKSAKKSVAEIDEKGKITANKPGETIITAKAGGSSASCQVIVKKPQIILNYTKATLYRGNTLTLLASTSSRRGVTWKSKKTSVAVISEDGRVTAKKHGRAVVTASLDGVTKQCEVTVKSPTIKLSATSLSIKKGKSKTLTAVVSSGNEPVYKSSKSSVASVDKKGKIKAKKKGTCIVYVSEDGTKVSCHVQVKA